MKLIALSHLSVSKQNTRKLYDNDNNNDNNDLLNNLSQSMASHGLLNPILVRPVDNCDANDLKYEIYAGQRRFLAAKKLGWSDIPCIVNQITDEDAKVKSLVENYHRQDNTYFEKIRTFGDIFQHKCNNNINNLCRLIGSNPKTVKRYLRLNGLSDEILELLDNSNDGGKLTLKTADLLVDIENQYRIPIINAIKNVHLSTQETNDVLMRFMENPDLNNLSKYIKDVTMETVNKRGISVQSTKTSNNQEKSHNANASPESSPESSPIKTPTPTSTPTPNKPNKEPKIKNEQSIEDLPENDKTVGNKKYPWIYDPNDKLKTPRTIKIEHLLEFWKLYQKLNFDK